MAVKMLKASVQADAAVAADFQKEAEMLCCLRHPNILDFYGACLSADTVCSPYGENQILLGCCLAH